MQAVAAREAHTISLPHLDPPHNYGKRALYPIDPGVLPAAMDAIVVATADEALRVEALEVLAARGFTAASSADWADTLAQAARDSTRLLLIDADLPGANGALLHELSRSLPHQPAVYTNRGELAPLPGVKNAQHLGRLAAGAATPVLTPYERNLLPLAGMGPDAPVLLQRVARNPLPVRIQGERGTGKQWIARIAHRLAGAGRPFVVLGPGAEPVIRGATPGTVYIEHLESHGHEDIIATLTLAEATGWRVMAGSRAQPEPVREGVAWTHIQLKPLRERPRELRPLSRLYLERYRHTLGLPNRRITPRLWKLIDAYPWPGNQRELETFVVQAATSARGASLSPDNLPRRVMALLDPEARAREEARAYEELVESRLQTVVTRFQPGDEPTLYRLVIDATERALFRLVLARTGGNQKAAAALLGVARNTLRTRLERLDPYDEGAS